MPSSASQFHVWRFLLSPRGRIARTPYLGVIVVLYVAFVTLVQFWSTSSGMVRPALSVMLMAVFPLKFIASAKRLHDINLPALAAAPALLLMAWAVYNNVAVQILHWSPFVLPGFLTVASRPFSYNMVALVVLLVLIVITDLILIFVPGIRGANRYGDDGRTPTAAVAELF